MHGNGFRLSRRACLRINAAALMAATPARAQQKLAKALVQYRDHPNGAQKCDGCVHFQPPQSCAIVEGVISPEGWCAAFAPKPG